MSVLHYFSCFLYNLIFALPKNSGKFKLQKNYMNLTFLLIPGLVSHKEGALAHTHTHTNTHTDTK